MPSASNRVLTDHEEIRRWAEERGGRPSCVKRTGGGGDVGILRIDFPGYSGENSLEEIEWGDWLDKFDESRLALIVQDTSARGQRSNFNKLVSRETAEESGKGHRSASRGSSSRGRKRNSSQQSSGSNSTQRSRNKNRAEGRSSTRRTMGRSGEGAGRSSGRSASTRSSSSRGKRAPSRTGSARSTRTSTSTSRTKSGGGKRSGRGSKRGGLK